MLQEIDNTLWTDPIKRIVKLSTDFKWYFYGRRFTNFCVSCYPDRRDYYRNKKTRNLCEGYRVHAYLDSIDDAEDVVLEHGKIYDCSYFDEGMNGCTIRLKAVTRKGELVLKELDCSN